MAFNLLATRAQIRAQRAHDKKCKAYEDHQRTPRAAMTRLYGHPIDIDKVWADRDALHDATQSMKGEKPWSAHYCSSQ